MAFDIFVFGGLCRAMRGDVTLLYDFCGGYHFQYYSSGTAPFPVIFQILSLGEIRVIRAICVLKYRILNTDLDEWHGFAQITK